MSLLKIYMFLSLKKKVLKLDSLWTPCAISGLSLTEEFRPDLILLDLMMPEMTGDEMLEELRKFDWAKILKL